jgi:hypothetical protein
MARKGNNFSDAVFTYYIFIDFKVITIYFFASTNYLLTELPF